MIKGDDKGAIEAKTKELTEVAGKLAEQAAAAGQANGAAADTEGDGNAKPNDDVVDAEFEEVKDDKQDGASDSK